MDGQIYQRIGGGYSRHRIPDPRWQAAIEQACIGAQSLLNVGAGSGSYEPTAIPVVALEPSRRMIEQRSAGSAPVVQGAAEHMPFADKQFDVTLAVLTTHHWSDAARGLKEMRRVSRRQVVVTWYPTLFAERFWLVRDYLPELGQRELHLATAELVLQNLPGARVASLPVPHDCVDGILGAYWRRPEMYLQETVRDATSGLALTEQSHVDAAMKRLENDLNTGQWAQRYEALLKLDALDLGYCLIFT